MTWTHEKEETIPAETQLPSAEVIPPDETEAPEPSEIGAKAVTDMTADPPAQEENAMEAEGEEPYDAERAAVLAAHPMFAYFAAGRQENFAALCKNFAIMLAAGGASDRASELPVRARMTPPSDGTVIPESGLTERQRMIARSAGMSYREYKALIDEIPTTTGHGHS